MHFRVRKLSRFVTPGTNRKFGVAERKGSIQSFVSISTIGKVATDTKILYLRTRYRTKLGWFFWFCRIQRYNTTKGKMANFVSPNQIQNQFGLVLWVLHDTKIQYH